jgi:FkbM family methyltransferase
MIHAKHNPILSPVRNTYNFIKHKVGHTHHLPRKIYEQVALEDPYGMKDVMYDLTPDSFVVEVGGFIGEWAARIYCLHSCNIDIYEPHPVLMEQIVHTFLFNNKVTTFNIALGNSNGTMKLYGDDMSASLLKNRIGNAHEVTVRKASEVFTERYSGMDIDLLSVNIEGAEYDVMPDIIENFGLESVKNIKICFHNNVKDYRKKTKEVQEAMSVTHHKVWGYEHWGESWVLL